MFKLNSQSEEILVDVDAEKTSRLCFVGKKGEKEQQPERTQDNLKSRLLSSISDSL